MLETKLTESYLPLRVHEQHRDLVLCRFFLLVLLPSHRSSHTRLHASLLRNPSFDPEPSGNVLTDRLFTETTTSCVRAVRDVLGISASLHALFRHTSLYRYTTLEGGNTLYSSPGIFYFIFSFTDTIIPKYL